MKKLAFWILTFIFIFLTPGCSCKNDDDENVERTSINVPMIAAYFSKDINGSYTLTYPFNTNISLVYFYASEGERASQYFKEEYLRLHKLFDRHYYYFDDNGVLINNLRVLNESNGEAVVVDQDLIDIINEGIKFTKLSKGKFNIGVGNLTSLWDGFIANGYYNSYIDSTKIKFYNYENGMYTESSDGEYIYFNGIYVDTSDMKRYTLADDTYQEDSNGTYIYIKNIVPTNEQIAQAMACIPSYEEIEDVIVIDDDNNTIKINNVSGCNNHVTITLGALAKSYAAEKIGNDDRLKSGNFLINAGTSTIKIIGENLARDNGNWGVGITDSYLVYSRNNNFASYLMTLEDEVSVSTSSGDQNHYYYNNHYYHHIIDPITGYPNENRLAVTAVTSNAMYADIATTALMSMNIEESKEFINTLKSNGIDVEIFIQDKFNDSNKVYATSNMKKWVTIRSNENLTDYLNSILIEDFNYDS